jgi:hypothetical protein
MSEKKHTPGPWKVAILEQENKERILSVFQGSSIDPTLKDVSAICIINDLKSATSSDSHNAFLIAAAPDMLEMLERLSESITDPATKIELSDLINRAKNG